MKEITGIILDIAFTVFAVYGTYTLTKLKKAARRVSKMCDEMHEEIHPTEKGGASDA